MAAISRAGTGAVRCCPVGLSSASSSCTSIARRSAAGVRCSIGIAASGAIENARRACWADRAHQPTSSLANRPRHIESTRRGILGQQSPHVLGARDAEPGRAGADRFEHHLGQIPNQYVTHLLTFQGEIAGAGPLAPSGPDPGIRSRQATRATG
jgi:hypothetical protein